MRAAQARASSPVRRGDITRHGGSSVVKRQLKCITPTIRGRLTSRGFSGRITERGILDRKQARHQ
jgi:hypothetical protein